jgi:hypothetical protein
MHVTSDKMLHGFGSFPGSPWSLSTSKSTGLEPMPLSNQVYFMATARSLSEKRKASKAARRRETASHLRSPEPSAAPAFELTLITPANILFILQSALKSNCSSRTPVDLLAAMLKALNTVENSSYSDRAGQPCSEG